MCTIGWKWISRDWAWTISRKRLKCSDRAWVACFERETGFERTSPGPGRSASRAIDGREVRARLLSFTHRLLCSFLARVSRSDPCSTIRATCAGRPASWVMMAMERKIRL